MKLIDERLKILLKDQNKLLRLKQNILYFYEVNR